MVQYGFSNDLYSSHNWILKLVDQNCKVLEIGCASGYLSRRLREKGCDVVCIDVRCKIMFTCTE